MKETNGFLPPMIIGKKEFDFSLRTYVMGILNVTPDSFSDGGSYHSVDDAIRHAAAMAADGADIIDVGGESTRPSGVYGETRPVSAEEEMNRVIPVIKRLSAEVDAVISVDTTKALVAEAALAAGASMINDISGLKFDPSMAEVASRYRAALALMHIQGTPQTMQQQPTYENVVDDVMEELKGSIAKAVKAGVQNIIIDPGIGFGKTTEHNLMLIKNLSAFKSLRHPVLIGTSRKGFIGNILDLPVHDRMEGTAATVAASIMNGANIIRVHDVRQMKRVAVVVDAITHS